MLLLKVHDTETKPMKYTPQKDQLKDSRSHDRNYVSAMFFRRQKSLFSDNEKKFVLIEVFECGESKYGIYFWHFFFKKGQN